MSPPTRRGRPGRPAVATAAVTRPEGPQHLNPRRVAEDTIERIDEAVIVLDAADVVAMAALSDRGYTPAEALQHVLELHAKVRRLLSFAIVEKAA